MNMNEKMVLKVHHKIFLGLAIMLTSFVFGHQVMAAMDKYAPGDTIVIGEFVYDDNMVATTTANCRITIYSPQNPSGNPVALDVPMTPLASGWNFYSTTTITDEGVWPTTMACGTAGVDLAKLDKTFFVGYDNASTTAISNAVWNNSASSSVATVINAHTDSVLDVASSSIVSQMASFFGSLPANIWAYISDSTRLAANVWNATTRKLTSALLGTGSDSLATNSYIDIATSTLVAEMPNGWTITMSDFGETTTLKSYQVKVYVLNSKSVPTDATTPPTLTITDAAGTEQKHNAEMTKSSDGVYYYRYTVPSDAVGGVWETEVSTSVEAGKIIKTNDYWNVSSSPADVKIISITDKTMPSIVADVEIINKGTSGSDFYYVYCIVDNEDNLCGGNDDVAYKSETVYIAAQKTLNLSLERDVLTPGTYWFKVKARALNENNWAASSEQFVATDFVVTPPVNSPGNGGGSSSSVIIPTITAESCNGADFNGDKKIDSVDFSILLAFWQKPYPFKNPCVDINKDKKVNSVEFSILLYEWGKK